MSKPNKQGKYMLFFRSFVFNIIFFSLTPLYLALMYIPMLILPYSFCMKLFKIWSNSILFILRYAVGIKLEIRGKENLENVLKNGPCILALKHQSAFETIICSLLLNRFVIILKKELLFIPLFGQYLLKLKSIALVRSQSSKSLRVLLNKSSEMLKQNYSILIFPEGTRQDVGSTTKYKGGVALMYSNLNVPVVPIALNAGLFWPKRSWIKKPGTIIFDILHPIQPGLDKRIFLNQLQETIEHHTSLLVKEIQ
ncbi:MAG: 1-acyl-sn-glycerol-3-phosphate acyltransferase [Candidatus Puniceispirillum sp.]|nr:1-acyl-sn-glycerol-3-phosphate acyltransferase [Candidatus Pelagibacter sp.]MBA4282697.1 1-acyl-sn-glycerol-3-phosphate acyltransferase [Candidatus Puniceispirillum sp.]